MKIRRQGQGLVVTFILALSLESRGQTFVRPPGVPDDVLPEYHNREVTALVEDSESVRLALGAAWDDALACRAYAGYHQPWAGGEAAGSAAEDIVHRGARMYERVKCVDDGIESVRLARDTRAAPRLRDDVRFWRNELALAATDVLAYAADAARIKAALEQNLAEEAARRGIAARVIPGIPWTNAPEREAWRETGPAVGVRLPLEPYTNSFAAWWDRDLSLVPGYLATKLASAGSRFVTPETPVGAWGANCTGPDQYDWTELDRVVQRLKERRCGLLLELPTLQPARTAEEIAEDRRKAEKSNAWIFCPEGVPPMLPAYLAADASATFVARGADGSLGPHGGVQLFNPAVAAAYGAYLKAVAAHLKKERLYDTVAAIDLERGDWAELPESIDYSGLTRQRWQKFLADRYSDVAALNRNAGTAYGAFGEIPIPVRTLVPRATNDWAEFTAKAKEQGADAWGNFLKHKYKTPEATRAALGDDYQDGYGWRLPFAYPPVLGIDYLWFRRAWVHDYLDLKRGLVQAAFPDKLVITELRQFGDHDGMAALGEKKWGGFLGDDLAQWSGVGADNATKPFMIRSVGPVGFGTRPSDSIESLFRDYLWIHFRDPGNLTRYFYHWVAHGYMDYQLGWHSIGNHWLSNQLIYQLGPTVANTAPARQRLGLLLPRATFDLTDGPVYYSFMGWDWALQAAKLPYTRIEERQVRDGRLAELGIEVLILPAVTAVDDAVARALADWVKSGGKIVAAPIPGVTDEYGRTRTEPALTEVLGVRPGGTTCAAVQGTPLTVTVSHGHYSGKWQTSSDRQPEFQVLAPTSAKTLATYKGGQPAIAVNTFGKGRAVTLGYPFGTELVECERTSIGFQRTYVWFVREPQLVARVAWLREFLAREVGFQSDYEVKSAEVERFKGVEEIAPDFHLPKGLSQDPADPFYIRTVGDPRPDHPIELDRESPDLAIRFFPRERAEDGAPQGAGLATRYLGISTREVHYLGPRATVNMVLARHTYRCRIADSRIQAIWDVARNVPVGFARDTNGVAFTVSLPSGHIMMLALSESTNVDVFAAAPFPGRTKAEALARCRKLAGGRAPPAVAILTPELKAWAEELAAPPDPKKPEAKETILISYGQPANRQAAETLAAFLEKRFGLTVNVTEQAVKKPAVMTDSIGNEWQTPVILIGDEWTNNDLGMHGAYWGIAYGAHLPFTATYAWPGPGRAVVSLSRRYALTSADGHIPFMFSSGVELRPVERRWPLLRRKLFIAANGADAERAVAEIVRRME